MSTENELSLYEENSFNAGYKVANALAKSKVVPASLQGKPDDIFAILAMGSEIGIRPMQALNSINVIQGKPTISPQLMMALVRGRLPQAIIDIKQNPENKSVTVKAARSKEEFEAGLYYEAVWDMGRAERMGLSLKDNYLKQAKTMLTWRAVAEACRMQFPDVIMGLYVPEEFQDFDGRTIPTVLSKDESKNMLDEDFPIPLEEKEVGDNYRMQNGKFRGKQFKEMDPEALGEYRDILIKRTTPKKDWEFELINVIGEYLQSLEPQVV